MANYSLVLNNTFTPLTYEELYAPIAQTQQYYDKLDEEYTKLLSDTDKLKVYAEKENESDWAKKYNNYNKEIEDAINTLYNSGNIQGSKKKLMDLRSRFDSNITVPIAAIAKIENDIERLKKIDPSKQPIYDTSKLTVQNLIDNPAYIVPVVYGSELEKNAMLAGATHVNALEPRISISPSDNPEYLIKTTRQGYDNDYVRNYIDLLNKDSELYKKYEPIANKNLENLNSEEIKFLLQIEPILQNIESTNIIGKMQESLLNDIPDSLRSKAINIINEGLIKGLEGTTKSETISNNSYRSLFNALHRTSNNSPSAPSYDEYSNPLYDSIYGTDTTPPPYTTTASPDDNLNKKVLEELKKLREENNKQQNTNSSYKQNQIRSPRQMSITPQRELKPANNKTKPSVILTHDRQKLTATQYRKLKENVNNLHYINIIDNEGNYLDWSTSGMDGDLMEFFNERGVLPSTGILENITGAQDVFITANKGALLKFSTNKFLKEMEEIKKLRKANRYKSGDALNFEKYPYYTTFHNLGVLGTGKNPEGLNVSKLKEYISNGKIFEKPSSHNIFKYYDWQSRRSYDPFDYDGTLANYEDNNPNYNKSIEFWKKFADEAVKNKHNLKRLYQGNEKAYKEDIIRWGKTEIGFDGTPKYKMSDNAKKTIPSFRIPMGYMTKNKRNFLDALREIYKSSSTYGVPTKAVLNGEMEYDSEHSDKKTIFSYMINHPEYLFIDLTPKGIIVSSNYYTKNSKTNEMEPDYDKGLMELYFPYSKMNNNIINSHVEMFKKATDERSYKRLEKELKELGINNKDIEAAINSNMEYNARIAMTKIYSEIMHDPKLERTDEK